MDRPTCKTCPYHLRQEQNDDQGTCCRFPPRVPDDYSQQSDALSMLWPLTFHDAACGEHPDFPAFIAATRRSPKTPPTAPPSSPPTPPSWPSERAPTTGRDDRPP
jgi:hypothetical protein